MNELSGTAGLADRPQPGVAAIDFRALFEAAPNPYVLLSPDLVIVEANAAYCAATLSERCEIMGKNLFEAFPSGPDDPNGDSVAQVRGSLERALREGRPDYLALVKYDMALPDGSGFEQHFWSATHTPLFGPDGKVAFLLQHTVDVTELHQLRVAGHRAGWQIGPNRLVEADLLHRARAVQAENASLAAETSHLRRLFEQAPGFIAVLSGPEHVFEMANAAYAKVTGHRDIIDKPVREALPEVVEQGFVELLDRVLSSGEPFVGRAMRILLQQAPHTAPSERFLDFVFQPIIDAEGTPTGIFVQGHDVTDKKHAEDALLKLTEHLEQRVVERTTELQQARNALQSINRNLEGIVAARMADLQAANEEIQRFAYIISHDLRSPLVNVMGFTSELDAIRETFETFVARIAERVPHAVTADIRTALEEDLPEAISFIRSSTERMDRLIKAILRLSREGRRVLSPEAVKMREMLTGYGDVIAHQLDECGAELSIGEIPDLTSDRLALEQIFGNLIENALKYLDPARPGRIEIRGWDDGPRVRIAVKDNGRGIESRDFERIFDLFRRAGAQDRPGEGIGLAHVRALVRRLGGSISVDSAVGVGSTFVVTLPKVLTVSTEAA
jgi:PAS domain S-box-containing protein